MLPAGVSDPSSMVSQALTLYKQLVVNQTSGKAVAKNSKTEFVESSSSSPPERVDEKSESGVGEAGLTKSKLRK